MAMTINTNVSSLNSQRNMSASQSSLATSLQRLSSGLRINSAKDDAAGLAISERINSQVKGFNVAIRNANDAISLMQVADGGAAQISDNLQRMRELAVQSANGTLNSGDRANLQLEFSTLGSEIDRLSQATKFNNLDLLSSAAAASLTFQVGAGTDATNQISVNTVNLRASALAIGDSTAIISIAGSSASSALAAIDKLDAAITTITSARAGFGAAQNRTEAVISSLQIAVENQSAARGRIVDADFASETANLSRSQILQQAGTAMLA
ncbi:MAG TPA: flagellin, partial [Rhodocyclaceae bacterium]|nr:flagellin [Rhodocyclaceae bacterium]